MVMMIKCKSCGNEQPSAIQMNEQSFESATLTNNSEQCTSCGQMSTYNKYDYFFR